VGGTSLPEFAVRDANANCRPKFLKNTAQNSPKHAASSPSPDSCPLDPTPRLQPSLLDPRLCVLQNSSQSVTTMTRPTTTTTTSV